MIDSGGKEVDSIAGPYLVGDRILLRCLSTGGIKSHYLAVRPTQVKHKINIKLGNPLPEVIWFKNKRRIDITYETTYSGVIQNTLDFGPLDRADQGRLDGI